MHRLFGQIQIPEQAHERRQNPSRFRPVKILNGPADLFRHRRHLRQISKQSGSTQLWASLGYTFFLAKAPIIIGPGKTLRFYTDSCFVLIIVSF